MSGRPKFSVFRAWVQPSPSRKANGDSLRPHSVPNKDEEERQVNIKLAIFFSVVALLFVLADHLGRVQERTDANLRPDSTALVSLTLSPPQRSGNRAGFSVRIRLSNRGNHSIFYPVRTATNIPIGQTCRTDSAAIGLDEFIQYLGTATPSHTGRQRPESQVD